ncbi:MAG: hypothetical protein QM762_26430 [Chryseolinea sp.]
MYEDIQKGRIKKSLFDQYRENLTIFAEHCNEHDVKKLFIENEVVVCPLCMNVFYKSQLRNAGDHSNYLTLEHVPPQSLGYTVEALTCFRCNNGSSKQDAALKFLSTNTSKIKYEVSIGINGLKLNGIFGYNAEQEKYELDFLDKADLLQFVALVKVGHKFTVCGNNPMPAHGGVLLKIAYLLAFSKFGYGLIMHAAYDIIRRHIKRPHEGEINNFGHLKINPPSDDLPFGVFFVSHPEELASICVRFKTISKASGGAEQVEAYTFFLPSPRTDVNAFYKLLDDRSGDLKSRIVSVNESVDYWFDPARFYDVVRILDGYSKGLI